MSAEEIKPSYAMAGVGGFFLGLLGLAVLLLFPNNTWLIAIVPVIGFLSGVLGMYVAAEPNEQVAGANEVVQVMVEDGRAKTAGETLIQEGTRLAREAAGLGSDGLKIAEAADILRREGENLVK